MRHDPPHATAFVATPDIAPGFWQLGNLWRVMAAGVRTDNRLCLIDQLVSAHGGGPTAHMHPADEGLYVVSGHCTFEAAGQTIFAGAGTFVAVPRYGEHAFTVDAPGTQLLNFYLPAGFECFIMGFAHPAEKNELPPPGVPLPPKRLVEQLSRDFGQLAVHGVLPGIQPPRPELMKTAPTPGATLFPFSSHASTAPAYWSADSLWTVLADGVATGGSYCLFDLLCPVHSGPPPHRHEEMEEVYYVLAGKAEFLLDDRREVAHAGSLVFIPRGTVHSFRTGSAGARFLNLCTPAGYEHVIATLGEPAKTRTLPPAGWQPPATSAEQRERLFAAVWMQSVASGTNDLAGETRMVW